MNKYTMNTLLMIHQSIHQDSCINEELHLRDEYSRLHMSSNLLKLMNRYHTYSNTRHTEPQDYRNIP